MNIKKEIIFLIKNFIILLILYLNILFINLIIFTFLNLSNVNKYKGYNSFNEILKLNNSKFKILKIDKTNINIEIKTQISTNLINLDNNKYLLKINGYKNFCNNLDDSYIVKNELNNITISILEKKRFFILNKKSCINNIDFLIQGFINEKSNVYILLDNKIFKIKD